MIKSLLLILLLASVLSAIEDDGARRMRELREMSHKSPNRIITIGVQQYKEYLMTYPRPYDAVVYFTAQNCKLCKTLYQQYVYTATLYVNQGIVDQVKNPVFFFEILYSQDVSAIFQLFSFNTAPNLIVSKPKMAVVSQNQVKNYILGFKWAISNSDGHVTTHKMLEFINKRTGKDVIYKPTFLTMVYTLSIFIGVAITGVFLYTYLYNFWMRWEVWFAGSIIIYITCVSGVVYDVIHDVPFVGNDGKGNIQIFSSGNREQYGAEGLVISVTISLIGLLWIILISKFKNFNAYTGRILSFGTIILVWLLVKMVEGYYGQKGWYNPMWFAPGDYQHGHYLIDQGNNI